MKIYLILSMLLFVACGHEPSAAEQKEKEHAAEVKGKAAGRWIDIRTTNADKALHAKDTTKPTDPVAHTGNVPAKPVAVVPAACDKVTYPMTGVQYVAAQVDFATAEKNAPKGKHLVTCGEARTLYDAGALTGIQFSAGQVWTATMKDTVNAYLLGVDDGSIDNGDINGAFGAIYVGE